MGPNVRERPLGRLKDRVREYMCVREVLPEGEGWIKQGGSVWTGRGGHFPAMTTPLTDIPESSKALEL